MLGLRTLQCGALRNGSSTWKNAAVRAATISRSARRFESTINMRAAEAQEQVLNKQRARRPISPHLTIYQPQLTWYLSSVHRVSLLVLGGAFYALTIALGLGQLGGLDATGILDWYNTNITGKTDLAVKAGFAYLFGLHYVNAWRHIAWDFAKELSLKGVYRTGYAVIGIGAVIGTYLLSII